MTLHRIWTQEKSTALKDKYIFRIFWLIDWQRVGTNMRLGVFCESVLQTLTYIQVGSVLHVVMTDSHLLRLKKDLRQTNKELVHSCIHTQCKDEMEDETTTITWINRLIKHKLEGLISQVLFLFHAPNGCEWFTCSFEPLSWFWLPSCRWTAAGWRPRRCSSLESVKGSKSWDDTTKWTFVAQLFGQRGGGCSVWGAGDLSASPGWRQGRPQGARKQHGKEKLNTTDEIETIQTVMAFIKVI